MAERVIEMQGISKSFPGVRALDQVDFYLEEGEIHALVGENGAGKSTLIKVMTGMYTADAGEIRVAGERVRPRSVFQMQEAGISTIYQEINLIPHMSVSENIALAREKTGLFGRIDWREARERARSAMARLGLDLDVDQPLNRFSTAVQQMVAIARALSLKARAVVMDEPTSSLNEGEITNLFRLIRDLRDQGVSFVFVSHKLREVFDLCQTVTVLRDGRLVGHYPITELDHFSLVSKMIGRDARGILGRHRDGTDKGERKRFCELNGIRDGRRLQGVSFAIGEGEILGLAGLLGSGRTETLRILFGAEQPEAGEIRLDGVVTRFNYPREAIARHLAFCPEDRKVEGIIPSLSLMDNIAITNLPRLSWRGVVSRAKKLALAEDYIQRLNIRAAGPRQRINTMSGGNQQKAILARWLSTSPRLILLDEPTRGIDVGARAEILDLIRRLAGEGLSVLMVSSEWGELLEVCDRILVYRDGRVLASLVGEEMTEDRIIATIAGEGRHA
ncbi:MAG: sugar ABC transporter ATP-binding protein [Planctomycetota bacterium]|jgi:ribose transport system ATP-binding protein|nr:sugar ABC transporter ATP-binding protein [Planctomycetota bacterium]